MDAIAVLFIAGLAVLLGWALALAISRGRAIERLEDATGAQGADDVERRVREALESAESANWQAGQTAYDSAFLTELLSIGVVHLRDDLIVTSANAAAHAILERRPGVMVGRPAMEAFIDARVEGIARTAMELGSANGELAVRSDAATTLVVRARRSPVSGVWLVMEDVSELRRLQRIRAEFIDNLAHELRTPLTTISLLAETAGRDAASATPRLRERIAKIEDETGHLIQMVNELLDLSKIESGTVPLLLDDVDLARVARTSAERLRPFAERQGLKLGFEIEKRVDSVRGDEDRLGQVVINLLHNAVKFSPNGGIIVVGVRQRDEDVVTWVKDPGIGIPAADRPRIFERFYKVDRARVRGRGGTGLGLAIARHVIETHGGRIWVESEEGEGSTFYFSIPLTSQSATLKTATLVVEAAAEPAAPAAADANRTPETGEVADEQEAEAAEGG